MEAWWHVAIVQLGRVIVVGTVVRFASVRIRNIASNKVDEKALAKTWSTFVLLYSNFQR